MSIQSNRLSAVITDSNMEDIRSAIHSIYAMLPFLTGLTIDERKSLPKINDSNKTFTEDAVTSANNNAQLIPSYFDPIEMERDLLLYEKLDELWLILSQLVQKIDDTRMLAGSEAYTSALVFYKLTESAVKAAVPGAQSVYAMLKQRFADQGNSGNAAEPVSSSVQN